MTCLQSTRVEMENSNEHSDRLFKNDDLRCQASDVLAEEYCLWGIHVCVQAQTFIDFLLCVNVCLPV